MAVCSVRAGTLSYLTFIFGAYLGSDRSKQENVGYHQKKIPHVEGQRRRSNKMVGGAKPHLESNPITARDARRAQTKLCVHQDPKAPQRLSQTCLLVFECLLSRHGSAVACHRDRDSGCSRPGTCGMWPKPF